MKTLENRIMEMMKELTEQYSLDYGNGEICHQFDTIYWTVEAPNNATIQIDYSLKEFEDLNDDEEIIRYICKKLERSLYYFDADDEFEEIWSVEFGKHNNFRPSQFLNMLIEDEEYFMNIYKEL
ncbi:MAG: hypothetical protein E6147_03295 [Peptostreptococcus sp.]|uniref:hypothetical protein n=1 Tax=Peptostreptococcus sp. TaxID=1262 RepID=UPI002909DBB8|nr:hypothetical protein [Peptostreptococcus sp.]MDU5350001.1 hypothetical protein [Peptostreptococcus sp.]MDU5891837.1 hypothetical protein [Peptostreptococcus sp.]